MPQALPKNTVLEGHVDQVQASDHKSDSTMTVTFDKAKLKDGKELPIKATVIAVSEPVMPAASRRSRSSWCDPCRAARPAARAAAAALRWRRLHGDRLASAPPPQPMNVPARARVHRSRPRARRRARRDAEERHSRAHFGDVQFEGEKRARAGRNADGVRARGDSCRRDGAVVRTEIQQPRPAIRSAAIRSGPSLRHD